MVKPFTPSGDMASNRVGIQGHTGKNEDKGERGDARSQGQIGFQGTRGPEGGLKPKGKDIFPSTVSEQECLPRLFHVPSDKFNPNFA